MPDAINRLGTISDPGAGVSPHTVQVSNLMEVDVKQPLSTLRAPHVSGGLWLRRTPNTGGLPGERDSLAGFWLAPLKIQNFEK